MRKIFLTILISVLLMPSMSVAERLRAFPGAEGFGAYVTGGRGGRVIYVTHVGDAMSGAKYAGSLRAALETPGTDPITIVFKCGGVILLAGDISCSRPNVTLAGQTAMGDGICLGQYGVKFTGNNVIVRHIRVRVSDEINQNSPALTFANAKNAIFDHCSFSWSTEENVNITDVDSVTFQWCINSESLYNSVHTKGARAYAAQWGGQRASYHHNLLAHHNSRMPRQNGNTSNDFQLTWDYRNNVHYNWGGSGAFYGGGVEFPGGFSHSNLINNYYVPGPATTKTQSSQYFCAPSGGRPAVICPSDPDNCPDVFPFGAGKWWLSGNVMKGNAAKTADNFSGLNPSEAVNKSGGRLSSDAFNAPSEFAIPAQFAVAAMSADTAYKYVLLNAGATLPRRDSIDRRIVNETKTQTAVFGGTTASNSKGKGSGIIDTHKDTRPANVANYLFNAWASYYTDVTSVEDDSKVKFKREKVIVYKGVQGTIRTTLLLDTMYVANRIDSDEDGMPDRWELANGLNPNDADDRNSIDPSSGYTMLEVYLNSIDGTEDQYSPIPTGIWKNRGSDVPHLRVYPNPVTTYLNVESVLEPQEVEVYTLMGTRVASYLAQGQRTFSVVPLAKGSYIVKVIFMDGKFASKQIVKK